MGGQFRKTTGKVRGEKLTDLLKKGYLQKETITKKSTIIAAQVQVAFGENVSPLCRLCLMHDETVIRIASECPKLKHCTRIQDMIKWQFEKFIHWKICKNCRFQKA